MIIVREELSSRFDIPFLVVVFFVLVVFVCSLRKSFGRKFQGRR